MSHRSLVLGHGCLQRTNDKGRIALIKQALKFFSDYLITLAGDGF